MSQLWLQPLWQKWLLRTTVVAALARAYNVFWKLVLPGLLVRKVPAAAVGFRRL